jgi:ATP-binding cassette subfamily B protein
MIGGLYYIRGLNGVNLATIVEFVIYINMLTFPVSAIGWTASMIQRASASQKRLNEFLQVEPEIRNRPEAKAVTLNGKIEFRNVQFTYGHTGITALKDFNLNIEPGQKVAIVGRTGSGKSTVAQLLLRMYDAQEGSILLDGYPIQHLDLRSLRAQVSYVPQDGFLFSDTVRNNIAFGAKTPDPVKVREAAERAVVAGEIESFPDQWETMVGERGVTLSGGQKQRVSIARALMKDAPILILDDSLSAVDARTEKEILSNLRNYLQDKTAIIITHRIFSLLQFDRIIVLEDGKIAETGTHEELLKQSGIYAEMYLKQLQEDNSNKFGPNLAVEKT